MTVATQWLVVCRKSSEDGRRHHSQRDGWLVVQWVTEWRDIEGAVGGKGENGGRMLLMTSADQVKNNNSGDLWTDEWSMVRVDEESE